jgi:hypothetical protein
MNSAVELLVSTVRICEAAGFSIDSLDGMRSCVVVHLVVKKVVVVTSGSLR